MIENNFNRVTVLLTIGLPGSGKTTFFQSLSKKIEKLKPNFKFLCIEFD